MATSPKRRHLPNFLEIVDDLLIRRIAQLVDARDVLKIGYTCKRYGGIYKCS